MKFRYIKCYTELTDKCSTTYFDVDFETIKCWHCADDYMLGPFSICDSELNKLRAVKEFGFIALYRNNDEPVLIYDIDKISFDKACELFKEFVKEYNEP